MRFSTVEFAESIGHHVETDLKLCHKCMMEFAAEMGRLAATIFNKHIAP